MRFRLFEDTLHWLSGSLADVGVGLVLLLSSQAMAEGSFTIGDFALFTTYLWFMVRMPTAAASLIAGYRTQEVARDRLMTLAATADARTLVRPTVIGVRGLAPDPAPSTLAPSDPLATLTVSRLSYHYRGTGRGIDNVWLRLEAGTMTIVTGRVGSGKTTLLRVLLGLLPHDKGAICWNGQRVADPASFFVPPRAAYTPQVPHLVSLSLRENILLGLSEDDVDLTAALRAAVLEEDVVRLPGGLNTIVGPRGVKLSGGQMQRAAAARMFVRRPSLFVFDDLSSALDVETEALLWQRLRAATRGAEPATILAVAHRPLAMQYADQVMVLQEGRVTYAGPPTQVR
jgi:ATP-binding cassette subfamily B protein